MNTLPRIQLPPALRRGATLVPLLLLALLAAAAPGAAQSARAKLYSKAAEDGRVLVAIQVTPDPGCWLYHDEPDSGGVPTEVRLSPATASWSRAWFPAPTVKDEPVVGRSKVHKEKFTIYAVGEGVEAADVGATLVGLACNDSTCLPWKVEDLERRGQGTEAVWADLPAALLTGAMPDEGPGDDGSAQEPGDAAPGDADDWAPDHGDDHLDVRAFARPDGDQVTVAIELSVEPGFHVYHGPDEADKGPGYATPTVPSISGGNVDWGEWAFPAPHRYESEGVPFTWTHDGRVVLRVVGEAFDEFDAEDVSLSLAGQVCDDTGCLPFELDVTLARGPGPAALFVADVAVDRPLEGGAQGAVDGAGATSAGGAGAGAAGAQGGATTPTRKKSDGLLAFLLLAFGAGLITLLMPCTYPMIPITISFFTKQASSRGGKVLPLALTYGAGIVFLFIAIGVIFGPLVVKFAQHWVTNMAIGVLFIVFALSLFGMFTLQPPRFLMSAAGQASQRGGFGGVFLMGACLVVTSFTCTAPFVGSLLGAGAAGGDTSILRIVLGMGVFGLTMATPFVLLALLPGRLQSIPQAGGWMETIKVFMGFVEVAASLKFFSNADITLSGGDYLNGGLLSRELFLALWAGIAVVAALYLFGRINLKGENGDGNIGPGRVVGGLVTVMFAAYCGLGVVGYQLGGTMSALAPPSSYTLGLIPMWQGSGGGSAAEKPTVIKDDYDLAVREAQAKGKLVLANFTAHT